MKPFLQRIAQAFYKEYGADVVERTFVFPNRRAGLFFQRYLSDAIDRPLFSPDVMTINECIQMAAREQPVDRLGALFRLYASYCKVSGSSEGFDNFVFWGEMLLADFDDVDKYLVDPRQLFTNVTELKEIDHRFNAFTENQIAAIREFWKNFDPVPDNSMGRNFVATWRVLLPLYEDFQQALRAEGLATEGMMYRRVAERLKAGQEVEEYAGRQFVFIGFNALTPAERCVFKELKKKKQADFYWDYEAAELQDEDNPASRFWKENTTVFPSRLDIEPSGEKLRDKHFELWAVPSQAGQAKQVYALLDGIFAGNDSSDGINTAVVLPDEGMLIPLIHSLPPRVDKVNVTMGFPLKATPAAGLIELVFELQRRRRDTPHGTAFYFQTVLNLLNHQYINLVCGDYVHTLTNRIAANNWVYVDAAELGGMPLMETIFTPLADTGDFLPYLMRVLRQLQASWRHSSRTADYRMELDFLYQYYMVLNRMNDIMRTRPAGIDPSNDTLMRLVRQLTAGISIPFVGEPLAGLQIMGVLETRGLDFENLIITSFNEGVFPRRNPQNSFIPYNLRRGFDLPTSEHQDALAAYHFYRLIHRARRVFLLYDSRTEGLVTGEVSRFAHQLHYHYGVSLQRRAVTFDVAFARPAPLRIEKSPEVMRKLEAFLQPGSDKALSASSINSYIDCPLQFYFTHVEGMQQADEVDETIQDNMFGTLFHAVMEYTYTPYKGQMVQPDDCERLMADQAGMDRHIARAFAEKYFKRRDHTLVPLEGNNLLVAHVLRKYVKQTLLVDKRQAPFRYIASEDLYRACYPLSDGVRQANLKGYIDRVDEKDGQVRILDYKTGSGSLDFKSFDDVFDPGQQKRPKYVLQTFLYGLLYRDRAAGKTIMPGIYYIRDTFKEDFDTRLYHKEEKTWITDFAKYEEDFRRHLTACLEEMFDPAIPFRQSTGTQPCQYCAYKSICNR